MNMEQDKQKITITLNMTIDDQGEMEYNKIRQSGYFFTKGKMDVLLYEEEMEDGAKIKNLITIHPHKVTINRTGEINMNQQFLLNQKTETYYQHPHGALHMETYTNARTYRSMQSIKQGQLLLSYHVKLNGIEERKHLLELTYQKEDYK